MKKTFINIILVLLVTIGGFMLYSQLQGDTSQSHESKLVDLSKKILAKKGSFTRIDSTHKASGEAVIYEGDSERILSLENFSVTQGPDLYVYLSKNSGVDKTKDLGKYISLGTIQKNKDDQTYVLPSDYNEYHSVVIWNKASNRIISAAELFSQN